MHSFKCSCIVYALTKAEQYCSTRCKFCRKLMCRIACQVHIKHVKAEYVYSGFDGLGITGDFPVLKQYTQVLHSYQDFVWDTCKPSIQI